MTSADQVRAVVAFSFGLRDRKFEPNPCNVRLARAAEHAVKYFQDGTLLIAQWEIARQLSADGVPVNLVVRPAPDGAYLDTDGVWRQALEMLNRYQVRTVVPIAQPFLHMQKIRRLIRQSGFRIENRHIGWIGFDSSRSNLQWWTRGPMRLLVYTVLQALGRQR